MTCLLLQKGIELATS